MRKRDEEIPVTELNRGERGIIVKAGENDLERRKLFALGILPGEIITLEEKYPVILLGSGYTLAALDEGVAKNIYVRRQSFRR
ncbi:MAG: ferrous iron transport protein A [Candidatus Syntrophonatronum acetioxidans]|uniref:Ferrous iron transport protein A n=1 Tax=Candidatus Syntrophonatronum acetioxidans TaxID=1795816 RepID=A0A424YAL0_9FIRM|nr:MAG: ferrous iron transport protein A [Candidatus Syntrophonatronum acetioxidans]